MRRYLFLVIFLGLGILQAVNVNVSASVNSGKVGLNEQLKYTIKIETDESVRIEEPKLPKIDNLVFRNVYSSSSSRTSIVNFKTSRSFSREYTYVFLPSKPGRTTIPSIEVRVGSSSYAVAPIEVDIVDSPQTNASPPSQSQYDPFANFGYGDWGFDDRPVGETFLIGIPEKTSAYIGEPIVISYYIYTEQGVTSLNLVDEKDFEGYGKEVFEQPSMLEFENATLRGRSYKRSLIKRIAISPNRTGTIKAPELSASVRLFSFGYSNRNVATQAINIEVKPLPERGRPDGFGGAIGSFEVTEAFSETNIALGEAISYTLTISGKGNFNQFMAPLFKKTPNIQVSAPVITDHLNAGVQGKRTLYYTIIPQEKGEYKLPRLEFAWFDASSGSYRSFSSKEGTMTVKPATVFSYFTNFFARDRVSRLNPLRIKHEYQDLRIYVRSAWYWVILALMGLSLLVSYYYYYLRKLRYNDPLRFSDIQSERILRKYLKDAKLAAQSVSADFYPLAEKGLMQYLAEKYKISNRLSIPEKLAELEVRRIPPELIGELKAFLGRCQTVRYMPGGFDVDKLSEDLETLVRIIRAFVKQKNIKSRGLL